MADAVTTLATASPEPAAPAAATPAPAATGQEGTPSQASAAEAKPDAKPAEGDKPAAAKPEATAPEKYEFKTPEGVQLDAEIVGEFEGIAKELGLPQEKAQRLVDLGAKMAQKHGASVQQHVEAAQTKWLDAAKSDKEFGGEKLQENLAVAQKAMKFASPELKTLLNESKLGNHPEVIRWMIRVGKAMSEDKPIPAGSIPAAPAVGPTPIEQLAKQLYPDHK
jgi:hypothetical protein